MQEDQIRELIRQETDFRVGSGFDVHQLVQGRKLILGGVDIPYELGLDGHSDADVLVHAIMDALLGAARLQDIGVHFPDTDPKWKGANSLHLAAAVSQLLRERQLEIVNIDAQIIAQRPKMSPYFTTMASNIARSLGIPDERVSVKATTTEHLGFCGRGEGIASTASALLRKIQR